MLPLALTALVLAGIAVISAVLLFVVSKKFAVYEDPRIGAVSEVLPQANCGGCGFPGCSGFAVACATGSDLEGKFCPVGGAALMEKVAEILGMSAAAGDPKIAVVRCNGTCEARPKINHYVGAKSCKIASSLYAGETACAFGCLGFGDCELACEFDALHMNLETGLPEINEEKCTACNACVKACPKIVIQLRKKGPKSRRIFVSCINKDKGGVAMKACKNACIGCGKCFKACNFGAIVIENNLAYIDDTKCRLCRKCVEECPTNAIHETNFPPRKAKEPKAEAKPAEPKIGEKAPAEAKDSIPAQVPIIEEKASKAEGLSSSPKTKAVEAPIANP